MGVITIGSGLGGWLTMMSMVNNWFSRQRSFAMATAMSGIHFGGFLVPVLAFFIDNTGFRPSMLFIGVLIVAIVAPVAMIMRNNPEDYGMRPDGDPPRRTTTDGQEGGVAAASEPGADEEPEYTAWQALKTPAFWVITITHMSSTLSLVALSVHLSPKLTDAGMSLTGAGVVILAFTLIALPMQFLSGYVADRMSKPPLICLFLLTQAAALVVIAYAESVLMAYLFALLWGIAFGGRGPLLTSIRGDYFRAQGVRHHNGHIAASHQHHHGDNAAVRRLRVRRDRFILHPVHLVRLLRARGGRADNVLPPARRRGARAVSDSGAAGYFEDGVRATEVGERVEEVGRMKTLGRELVEPFGSFWELYGEETGIASELVEEGHSAVFGSLGADLTAPAVPEWTKLPDDDLAYHAAHELSHILLRRRGFPYTARGTRLRSAVPGGAHRRRHRGDGDTSGGGRAPPAAGFHQAGYPGAHVEGAR